MDESIRIVWYDLPEDGKDEYLKWLHETYLPTVMARPGILWAAHYRIIKSDETIQKLSKFVGRSEDHDSVPAGSDYALLIGAGSPHVFFKPNFDDVDSEDPIAQKMFAKHIGRRTVVTTEQARVDGPEIRQRA
ncbi:MAG: hypothetical protein HOF84_03430, partial [Rhodospirillales bacterium]|nr:hypothetical protein [Rhodospirillales bacterium]